jgi:hypothetical protein
VRLGGNNEWVDTVYRRREAAASASATGRSRAAATPLRRRGAFGSNTERRTRSPPIRGAIGEEVLTSFYTSCSEELVAEFDGESGGGLGDIQPTDRFISFYHFSTGYVRGLLGETDIPVEYGRFLRPR